MEESVEAKAKDIVRLNKDELKVLEVLAILFCRKLRLKPIYFSNCPESR